MEREHPELCDWGDMKFSLLKKIAKQIPEDIVIQFHNNGEPLLYPRLAEALDLFPGNIRCLDTNGKLVVEKAEEIIGRLDTMTISVIQDDPEGDRQFELIKEFLEIKKDRKPFLVYRLLGNIQSHLRWEGLPGESVSRLLHSPDGSFNYSKRVTKPEIGVCLDLLHHLVIDRYGNVSPCVRFDPHGYNFLGNVNDKRLIDIWNSDARRVYLHNHLSGSRECSKLCKACHYWGCPTGY